MAITINGKQYDENKIDQNIKNSIGQVQFLQRRMNELQLDFDNAKQIFKILFNLKNKNRVIIFATHNRYFANMADCKLQMINGKIKLTNARVSRLTRHKLSHATFANITFTIDTNGTVVNITCN